VVTQDVDAALRVQAVHDIGGTIGGCVIHDYKLDVERHIPHPVDDLGHRVDLIVGGDDHGKPEGVGHERTPTPTTDWPSGSGRRSSSLNTGTMASNQRSCEIGMRGTRRTRALTHQPSVPARLK